MHINYLPCVRLSLYRIVPLCRLKQALEENQVQIYGLLARSQDMQDFRIQFYHTHHAIQHPPR